MFSIRKGFSTGRGFLCRALGTVVVAAVGMLGTALVTAAPAHAETFLPDPYSGAVVTHLALTARHGYLNVTLIADHNDGQNDRIVGFTVAIPAAGGTWVAAASRTFTAAGLTCTGAAGPDLLYTCLTAYTPGEEDPYAFVPTGRYSLSFPVSRPTGPTDGVTGSVALTRETLYGDGNNSWAADTFPVLDMATDQLSSAEVRELLLLPTQLGSLSTGVVSVNVVIRPGEQVTGIYLSLPLVDASTAYTVQYRQYPNQIACGPDSDYPVPSSFVISCHDTLLRNGSWPAGRYQFNLHVASIGDVGGPGLVGLRHLGGMPAQVDDFVVYQAAGYQI